MACLHVFRWILLVLKSEEKNVQVQRDFRFVLMPAYQLLASLLSVSTLLEMFIPGVGSHAPKSLYCEEKVQLKSPSVTS